MRLDTWGRKYLMNSTSQVRGLLAESGLKRRNGVALRIFLRLIAVIVLVVIWWSLTRTVFTNARIYPPPDAVLTELLRIVSGNSSFGSSYTHAATTFARLLIAFTASFVVGTLLGIFAGRIPLAYDFLKNPMWIGMAVPAIVWVFILVIAMGIHNAVPIVALLMLLTPLVFFPVAEGTKAVPRDLMAMADSYKISRYQRLTGIYLPSVVPYMASSARVAFSMGIKVVIIAEVIGVSSGIGLLLKDSFDRIQIAPLIAWNIIFIAAGSCFDYFVFSKIERRALKWQTGGLSVNATISSYRGVVAA